MRDMLGGLQADVCLASIRLTAGPGRLAFKSVSVWFDPGRTSVRERNAICFADERCECEDRCDPDR